MAADQLGFGPRSLYYGVSYMDQIDTVRNMAQFPDDCVANGQTVGEYLDYLFGSTEEPPEGEEDEV